MQAAQISFKFISVRKPSSKMLLSHIQAYFMLLLGVHPAESCDLCSYQTGSKYRHHSALHCVVSRLELLHSPHRIRDGRLSNSQIQSKKSKMKLRV